MRSVADHLRRETARSDRARTAGERLRLALELGDADCNLAAAYRNISVVEARRLLSRNRQQGRIRSRSHESLLA
jgi:hypothetical protein